MTAAKKDPFGYPELLVQNTIGELTNLIAEANKALRVTEGKRLKQVIEIDLSTANTLAEYNISFTEMAVIYDDAACKSDIYIDDPITSKRIRSFWNGSFPYIGTKFYVSNEIQPGKKMQIILLE